MHCHSCQLVLFVVPTVLISATLRGRLGLSSYCRGPHGLFANNAEEPSVHRKECGVTISTACAVLQMETLSSVLGDAKRSSIST